MRFASIFFTLTAAAVCALVTTGCRKDRNPNAAEDTGYASDYVQLERSFNNVQDVADMAVQEQGVSLMKGTSQCVTVTHDTLSIPHVLTMDYGSSNCLCADGKNRRGKILVSYTGHYADSGSQRDFSFDQYFVNDNQLLGTKTVTNMGHNTAGQIYYNVTVNGSLVLANGNGTRSWNSIRTRTWTAGYGTPTHADDAYDIAGSGTLTRPNGNSFSLKIVTPLHRSAGCDWIESGVLEITPVGGAMRSLDFGGGSCDNIATLTRNGQSRTIHLP